MKSKTIWYTLLLIMIFGCMVMEFFSQFIGIIIFGLAAYAAGAYHIKFRLERDDNEYDKIIGGKI